jgi:hypothetical protein
MSRLKTRYGCIWVCRVMVVEVAGSNPADRVEVQLYTKKCVTCDGDGWLAGQLGCSHKKYFFLFFGIFTHPRFLFFNRLANAGHPVNHTWKWWFHVQAFYPILEIAISKCDSYPHLKMRISPLLQTFFVVVALETYVGFLISVGNLYKNFAN